MDGVLEVSLGAGICVGHDLQLFLDFIRSLQLLGEGIPNEGEAHWVDTLLGGHICGRMADLVAE